MATIRVARLATKKKRVIKIGGAYHGWSDQLVYSLKVPNTKRYEAHGIPALATRWTDEARPNDLASLERVLARNKLLGGTACVLIEPVGPESGTRPVAKDYNKGVRALCDKYGALLVFDEVVTAFRLGLGGAQGYFDVKPDLTAFGKIVAGGYPSAGGLGGRRDLVMLMAAGLETGKKRAYVGGTMAANPLSAAAGSFTLQEIEKRLAIEARYVGSQKERLRFESLLRRIYGADDVSSLLDIVPDIRDIVRAASVSVYLMEENDVIGRYLKPLVWDNAFLTHSDFSKFIAPLEAQDFAASAARFGRVCEEYALALLDRSFGTLDYWKSVKK